MKSLRKHWRATFLAAAVVLLGGLVFWRAAEARMALFMQQEPGYTPVSQFEYDHVQKLLAETNLDREALIALNLSSQQAEAVLDAVRDFRAANASTLGSLEATVHQKATAVYSLEQTIRTGPFNENNESALATAWQDLANAKAAYKNALASLESTVDQTLSGSQRTTWAAIKVGHGQQMPIRMLALDDSQRLAIGDAWHRYRRQHGAAASQEERASAVSTWQSALDQTLTNDQKTVVSNYNSNYGTASSAVNEAFEVVLSTEGAG